MVWPQVHNARLRDAAPPAPPEWCAATATAHDDDDDDAQKNAEAWPEGVSPGSSLHTQTGRAEREPAGLQQSASPLNKAAFAAEQHSKRLAAAAAASPARRAREAARRHGGGGAALAPVCESGVVALGAAERRGRRARSPAERDVRRTLLASADAVSEQQAGSSDEHAVPAGTQVNANADNVDEDPHLVTTFYERSMHDVSSNGSGRHTHVQPCEDSEGACETAPAGDARSRRHRRERHQSCSHASRHDASTVAPGPAAAPVHAPASSQRRASISSSIGGASGTSAPSSRARQAVAWLAGLMVLGGVGAAGGMFMAQRIADVPPPQPPQRRRGQAPSCKKQAACGASGNARVPLGGAWRTHGPLAEAPAVPSIFECSTASGA
jgi:hypothetical protein